MPNEPLKKCNVYMSHTAAKRTAMWGTPLWAWFKHRTGAKTHKYQQIHYQPSILILLTPFLNVHLLIIAPYW
jgi:hypothetical protein